MAIAVTLDYPRAKKVGGTVKMISGTIAFDSSYPTGGELAKGANGITRHFKTCTQIVCEPNSGYMFTYDKTNAKIKVYAPMNAIDGGATAGANNTLVIANSQIEVAGTGANTQAPGGECLDTSNLVALTAVRFIAYGY